MARVVTEIDRDAPLSEQLLLGAQVQVEALVAEIAQLETTQALLDLTQDSTPAEIETSQVLLDLTQASTPAEIERSQEQAVSDQLTTPGRIISSRVAKTPMADMIAESRDQLMEVGAETGFVEPKGMRSGERPLASSPRTAAGAGSNYGSMLKETPLPGFRLPPYTPVAVAAVSPLKRVLRSVAAATDSLNPYRPPGSSQLNNSVPPVPLGGGGRGGGGRLQGQPNNSRRLNRNQQ
jgi:hypothetical protein